MMVRSTCLSNHAAGAAVPRHFPAESWKPMRMRSRGFLDSDRTSKESSFAMGSDDEGEEVNVMDAMGTGDGEDSGHADIVTVEGLAARTADVSANSADIKGRRIVL
jgi:hypothetical protein